MEVTTSFPHIRCLGIEPVQALREQGISKGIPTNTLIDGDAYDTKLSDESFDVVAEFAVLHYVRRPDLVIAEMLRVAKRAIFIFDTNNFGHGSFGKRWLKHILRQLGLWRFLVYVRTGGKGYDVSEGDGIAYSYSVFDSFQQIRKACPKVYILNTKGLDMNYDPLWSASHVALLGIKD